MNHKYERKAIPVGQAWVVEVCECGAISRRYTTGFRTYFDMEGNQLKKADACMRTVIEKAHPEPKRKAFSDPPIPKTPSDPSKPAAPVEEPPIKKKFDSPGLGVGNGGPPYGKGIFKPHTPLSTTTTSKVINTKSGLTDVEARLKDSMVLVKLLYEEFVTRGIECKVRNMAGRYLYSNGYEELVNNLNRKSV